MPSSTIGASGVGARFAGLAQLVHEAAERQAAVGFVLPRHLDDLQDVGEHLLAAAPQHEARVRAGRFQQLTDRLGDRPVIAQPVQLAQDAERLDDGPSEARQDRRARRRAGTRGRARDTRAALPRQSRRTVRASVANTDSASPGHSIAVSAVRSASTSSRSWNALPPTSRCGTPRDSSASTYGCVTSSWKAMNRRNSRQISPAAMARRWPSGQGRSIRCRRSASERTRPSPLAATRRGSQASPVAAHRAVALAAPRPPAGSRGPCDPAAARRSPACSDVSSRTMCGAERGVHRSLNRGHTAERRAQRDPRPPPPGPATRRSRGRCRRRRA